MLQPEAAGAWLAASSRGHGRAVGAAVQELRAIATEGLLGEEEAALPRAELVQTFRTGQSSQRDVRGLAAVSNTKLARP